MTLARAHRAALLLEIAGKGLDVELDVIAGLLLVTVDGLDEAVEPGRLVDDHRDRNLAAGGASPSGGDQPRRHRSAAHEAPP